MPTLSPSSRLLGSWDTAVQNRGWNSLALSLWGLITSFTPESQFQCHGGVIRTAPEEPGGASCGWCGASHTVPWSCINKMRVSDAVIPGSGGGPEDPRACSTWRGQGLCAQEQCRCSTSFKDSGKVWRLSPTQGEPRNHTRAAVTFLLPGVSGKLLAPSRCIMELALSAILFALFPGALLGSENLTADSYSLSPVTDSSVNLDSGEEGGWEQQLQEAT